MLNFIINISQHHRTSGNVFVSEAEDQRFDSRAGQKGKCCQTHAIVATFSGRNGTNMGPCRSRFTLRRETVSVMTDLKDLTQSLIIIFNTLYRTLKFIN